jgi:hypothetical protein
MRRLLFLRVPDRTELLRFFYRGNWNYIAEHAPTAGDPLPHSISWAKGAKNEYRVDFVDDTLIRQQYLVLSSPELDKEDVMEQRMRSGPFVYLTVPEIIREFEMARDPKAVISAFTKVVLIAPQRYDRTFADYVARVLQAPDAEVRAEGLKLMTHIEWPELKPLAEPLAHDPDERVRSNAQIVLDGYRELGIA